MSSRWIKNGSLYSVVPLFRFTWRPQEPNDAGAIPQGALIGVEHVLYIHILYVNRLQIAAIHHPQARQFRHLLIQKVFFRPATSSRSAFSSAISTAMSLIVIAFSSSASSFSSLTIGNLDVISLKERRAITKS